MKCTICKSRIDETFLRKLIGTYVKDAKGKRHPICFSCQKQYTDKEKMLAKLPS